MGRQGSRYTLSSFDKIMKLLWALLLTTVFVAYADNGIFCSLCTELITSLEDELQEDEPDIIKVSYLSKFT